MDNQVTNWSTSQHDDSYTTVTHLFPLIFLSVIYLDFVDFLLRRLFLFFSLLGVGLVQGVNFLVVHDLNQRQRQRQQAAAIGNKRQQRGGKPRQAGNKTRRQRAGVCSRKYGVTKKIWDEAETPTRSAAAAGGQQCAAAAAAAVVAAKRGSSPDKIAS